VGAPASGTSVEGPRLPLRSLRGRRSRFLKRRARALTGREGGSPRPAVRRPRESVGRELSGRVFPPPQAEGGASHRDASPSLLTCAPRTRWPDGGGRPAHLRHRSKRPGTTGAPPWGRLAAGRRRTKHCTEAHRSAAALPKTGAGAVSRVPWAGTAGPGQPASTILSVDVLHPARDGFSVLDTLSKISGQRDTGAEPVPPPGAAGEGEIETDPAARAPWPGQARRGGTAGSRKVEGWPRPPPAAAGGPQGSVSPVAARPWPLSITPSFRPTVNRGGDSRARRDEARPSCYKIASTFSRRVGFLVHPLRRKISRREKEAQAPRTCFYVSGTQGPEKQAHAGARMAELGESKWLAGPLAAGARRRK